MLILRLHNMVSEEKINMPRSDCEDWKATCEL